jgi:protein TonB
LLKSVPPTYPPLAKTARIEGTVRFKANIGKDGTVDRMELLSGPQILVQAAREAVLQWVYRPAMLDGAPAETATQIEVRFTLSR